MAIWDKPRNRSEPWLTAWVATCASSGGRSLNAWRRGRTWSPGRLRTVRSRLELVLLVATVEVCSMEASWGVSSIWSPTKRTSRLRETPAASSTAWGQQHRRDMLKQQTLLIWKVHVHCAPFDPS